MKKKCPKCYKIYENQVIKCSKCDWYLIDITDEDAEKENKFNNRFSLIIILAGIIVLGIIICTIASGINRQNEPPTYLSDVRCSWCSKVIRADGRNIHGHVTSFSDEFLECEYCGHNTRITK